MKQANQRIYVMWPLARISSNSRLHQVWIKGYSVFKWHLCQRSKAPLLLWLWVVFFKQVQRPPFFFRFSATRRWEKSRQTFKVALWELVMMSVILIINNFQMPLPLRVFFILVISWRVVDRRLICWLVPISDFFLSSGSDCEENQYKITNDEIKAFWQSEIV